MKEIFTYLKDPLPFEKGNVNIWTEKIFENLVMNAHLNSEVPGGSQDKTIINSSVDFIDSIALNYNSTKIIDLGCGPGLYTELLAKKGYAVTGIDISPKSIEYAKKSAEEQKLSIQYLNEDFIHLQINEKFDFCILVYQIFATLSPSEQKNLLTNIHKLLRSNGVLMFDVPTVNFFEKIYNINIWESKDRNNDLSSNYVLSLFSNKKYENNLLLKRSIYYFENNTILHFNDWLKHYSFSELKEILLSYGFEIKEAYSDFTGNKYDENSDTLTVLCKKQIT